MIAEVSLSDPQHIVSLFAEGVPPPSDIEDLPKPPISGVRPSHLKEEGDSVIFIRFFRLGGGVGGGRVGPRRRCAATRERESR